MGSGTQRARGQKPALETEKARTWDLVLGLRFWRMERVRGIEPPLSAWEADVLPLNYTRAAGLPVAETSIADPRAGNHVGSARRVVDRPRSASRRPPCCHCRRARLLRCQRPGAELGAECIEKGVTDGLHRRFLGSFSQRARSGLGRVVIFWQIRTCCRGQHSTQREDAVLDRATWLRGNWNEGVNGGNRHY